MALVFPCGMFGTFIPVLTYGAFCGTKYMDLNGPPAIALGQSATQQIFY